MQTETQVFPSNEAIRQHLPLVRRLAHQMMLRVPPSVEMDDLLQVGLIGLSEALTRYEAEQGVSFETFAAQRIRGAMIDELRGTDWMSRRARQGRKDIERAVHKLSQALGRQPTDGEIAGALDMKLDEYRQLVLRACGTQLVYLEDLSGADDSDEGYLDRHLGDEEADPMSLVGDRRMRGALVEAIQSLPERDQQVMSMYYEHDMSLKEIAAVLGVTESRVCQLHSQAVAKLRSKMRAH